MINETYQKLLEELDIHSNPEIPFYNTDSPKMEELCKLLAEYSKIVNPFGSGKKLKDPIDYLNLIERMLSSENNTRLCLSTKSACTLFIKDKSGWMYHSKCYDKRKHNKSAIIIEHIYNDGTDEKSPLDEVVLLSNYEEIEDGQDSTLEISLKTGLAWENYEEENAKPATDAQIKTIIDCLKISIEEIQRNIVNYMICDN